jgi:hypothetical protein
MLGISESHNRAKKRVTDLKKKRSWPETEASGAVAVNRKSDSARHMEAVRVLV